MALIIASTTVMIVGYFNNNILIGAQMYDKVCCKNLSMGWQGSNIH